MPATRPVLASLRTAAVCFLTSMTLCASLLAQTLKARQNYDPVLVAQQFQTTDPQLRIVVSHRGIWKQNQCPENSHCAFYDAKQDGVEAVEVDVKASKDGTLWALHDYHIGRVTTYPANSQGGYFDQSKPIGPGNENPLVSTLTDAEIGGLYLRYADGQRSKYHPYTIEKTLNNIRNDGHMVAMLDLKNALDVSRAAAIVRELGMEKIVILKFPSSIYNLQGFYLPEDLKGLLFVPVVYAPDLPRIGKQGGSSLEAEQAEVNNYLTALSGSRLFESGGGSSLYVEFGMKSPDGKDPLRPSYNFEIYTLDRAAGSFQPVPDASGGRYYLENGGYYTLDQVLTKNIEPFPNEITDDRENSDFQLKYFNSIITDDPVSLIQRATDLGDRTHIANLCFNHNCTLD